MALTKRLPRIASEFAIIQSDYVEGRALAANTAERVAVPQDSAGKFARFVLFAGSDNFCAKLGDASVTAAMPTDTTDGSGSMLNPTLVEILDGQTHVSVISTNASVLTMSFFRAVGQQ